ncbi:MAG TPA: ATP-dependent DNA helicase [Holophaga sp.]|nr:ATP-dependent DNA helicase [Holophaga sp.]
MELALAVTSFVAPLEPSGDLDASLSFRMDEDAMAQGVRLHVRIQKRLLGETPDAQAEVPVLCELGGEDFTCRIRGRMDVLLPSPWLVEEIKSTYQPGALLKALEAQEDHPFAQQARFYAWAQARRTGEPVACRLRVVSLLDEEETVVPVPFDPEAFEAWVEVQVQGLHQRCLQAQARAEARARMGLALDFPFEDLRQGQAHLMALAEEALAGKRALLVQAPTGLGKTAALLHPALRKALLEDLRVFYATPRNSQHAAAEGFVRLLREQGHAARFVTLRAKEKVCPQAEVHCTPEACPRARGYYDRLKASGVLEELADAGCADVDLLREAADRHLLCPFELSLDAARNADVVIGDYNYVLAPHATVQRFFGTPEESARCLVLFDEAHNLPARAADWFSPALDLAQLAGLRKAWRKGSPPSLRAAFTRQLRRCIRLLEGWEGIHRRVEVDPEPFQAEEARLRKQVAKAAAGGASLPPGHPLVQLFRLWSDFCAALPEARIVTWIPPGRLQITCPEASAHLAERMKALAGTVLFSGTLKPFPFYEQLSGLAGSLCEEVASPFPPEHRLVLMVPQVSTLFRRREAEIPRVAEFLSRVLPLRRGNYLVFFPSFDFLERTRPLLDLPGFQVLAQPRQAAQADLATLLDGLREERGQVVLAVQGGSLSEGVDLPGEALIGCVVVGPPLPPFDLERRLVKEHFDRRFGNGEDYAYTFPAMAKAVQAAGRVLRGPEDRGLIVFLDGRFLEPAYAQCLPREWFRESPREGVSRSILADVRSFWASVY